MKKFYLLTKTLLVAVCLLVGASNAWGTSQTKIVLYSENVVDNIDYNINTYYISVKNSKTNVIGTYKYSYNNY